MYNGVGLTTPRGSGSSGYVQKNLAYIRRPKSLREFKKELEEIKANPPKPPNKPNAELIEHEQKRQIEIRLLKFREELVAKGEALTEVDQKVAAARTALYSKLKDAPLLVTQSSHQRNLQKEKDLSKVKSAFNVKDDYIPGSSFDFDALEEKRLQELDAKMQLKHEAELKRLEAEVARQAQAQALEEERERRRAIEEERERRHVIELEREKERERRQSPAKVEEPVIAAVEAVPIEAPLEEMEVEEPLAQVEVFVEETVPEPVKEPARESQTEARPRRRRGYYSSSSSSRERRRSRSPRRRPDSRPTRRYRSRSRSTGRRRRRSNSSDYDRRPQNSHYEKRPSYRMSSYSDSSYSDSD